MKRHKRKIYRKEFLKTSSAAFMGLGIFDIGGKKHKAVRTTKTPSGTVELGRTGIRVPLVGFGASRSMEPSLVNAATDAGFYFLDTGRPSGKVSNHI